MMLHVQPKARHYRQGSRRWPLACSLWALSNVPQEPQLHKECAPEPAPVRCSMQQTCPVLLSRELAGTAGLQTCAFQDPSICLPTQLCLRLSNSKPSSSRLSMTRHHQLRPQAQVAPCPSPRNSTSPPPPQL